MEDTRPLRRLKARQEELIRSRLNFMRNNPGKSTSYYDQQIFEVKRKIQAFEENLYTQPTTLGQALPPDDEVRDRIYKKVVAISLAADFLNDTASEFKSDLNKYNIESARIISQVKEIVKLTDNLACLLLDLKGGVLDNVLLNNQDLIKKLEEETMLYIDNSLNT